MKVPLAARLRKVRRAKDLTQQELGELAGINYTTISRIESGEAKQVYADTVYDLAKALGVSADYLLGLNDEEMSDHTKRSRARKAAPVG